MLADKIKNRESGVVLYGITPPKKGIGTQRVLEISSRQTQRLKSLNIDGVIVYDIQDENSRTTEERPFPFNETIDSFEYCRQSLNQIPVPKIVYRVVGKYSQSELTEFLSMASPMENMTVFVGAASKNQQVKLTIDDAYKLKQQVNSELLLGGVVIPERHQSKGDEHQRVFRKISRGCSFFVSQVVYDVDASKKLLSEYSQYGRENNIPLVPIIFTLTPCGSPKMLQFMKWLGISIPRWLENEMVNSEDILQRSIELSEKIWLELKAFADDRGIPIGCNIESVAVRKVDVDASIELLRRIQK